MKMRARRVIVRLNNAMGYASGIGMLVLGLILFYEVIMRYIFNAPTSWVQEVSIYLFMWTMFAGAAYTLEQGKHVHIDLLISHLSPAARRKLEMLTGALGLIFSIVVTYQGYEMVMAAFKYHKLSATPLRFPMWIPQMSLPVGFLLLSVQFAAGLIDRLENTKRGVDVP
jgi:TRAP-type C4-dicarboxylate transport system permease small subunit